MDKNKVEKWLQSYLRLRRLGHVGLFLSDEYKEFKKEDPKPNCDLLTWCIRKALEELTS